MALSGRRIVIIGGSSGMGLATARAAALASQTLTKSIGEADQIAAAHLYLMDNRFVTGTVLTVDGGATLGRSE